MSTLRWEQTYDSQEKELPDLTQKDTVSKVIRGLLCSNLADTLIAAVKYDRKQAEKKAAMKNGKNEPKPEQPKAAKQNVK